MSRSLRVRLLLGTSLASAIILGLLGAGIYFSMSRMLLREFDTALLAKAHALSTMAEQQGSRIKVESDYQQFPEFTRGERPEFFELRQAGGKTIAASPSLHERKLDDAPQPPAGTAEYRNIMLPDGRHGRMIAYSFNPRNEREDEDRDHPAGDAPQVVTLILASETHAMHETMEDLRLLLISLCSSAIVISGVMLFIIVGRAMRPLRAVAGQIERTRETDLASRLDAAAAPTELHPVIDKLNGLLGRLQEAFSREKSFTADVAHELRTPLSGIQATLQVCMSRPRESAEYVAAIDKCLRMTADMRGVIESLLLLARADAGQLAVQLQSVDLEGLIRECWGAYQCRAGEREIKTQITLPEFCQLRSDPDKLHIVLNNLMDNAVSYCDSGGAIHVELRSSDDTATIDISNSGSQLSQEEAAKVFDRFWRADMARSQTGLHCGLGLSLCSRLATLLGGTISASSTGGIFRVRWTLPLKAASARIP